MLGHILKLLGLAGSRGSRRPSGLITLERGAIEHLLRTEHTLPHVDWGAADAWMRATEADEARHPRLRRAIAAAWLDELRDALPTDYRRWRHQTVEGLTPLDLGPRVAAAADRALGVVSTAMRPLRGRGPIPQAAIIALQRTEDYYSFISHYYPEEGQWGTSGGVYINDGDDSFPMIVLPVQVRWSIEDTIAHELTHHALRTLELPQWAEEGLTQMMEERVTGRTTFSLDHDVRERHAAHWGERGFESFVSGESFHSPEDDEQELSYHLAQLLVRGLLSERPASFFAFARACRSAGAGAAASQHLGSSVEALARRATGIPG